MKFFTAVFAIFAVFASASAFGLPETLDDHRMDNGQMVRLEDVDTDNGIHASASEPMIRHRRSTLSSVCNSLDITSLNLRMQVKTSRLDRQCALKCLQEGRAGGRCKGTTCVCRTSTWTPMK